VPYKLGVDIGGTFTDFLLLDVDRGKTELLKVPSTPDDPSEAVATGVARLCSALGLDPKELVQIVHGTTVATNALLEEKGAKVGLVTTEGFGSTLHLARGMTPGPLAGWITMIKPDPLADLEDTIEARERMDHRGEVIEALDEEALRGDLANLLQNGIESLTISFLHSYANDAHEQAAAEVARTLDPSLSITAASEIVAEFREYERTETAVINSYIKPTVSHYLTQFTGRLAAQNVEAPVNLLRSDGGMMTIADAAERPVYAVLSGPAGGVAGAVFVGAEAGFENILTFDMGGTSTDVSLCAAGTPSMTWETRAGTFPVKVPSIEIATVGAGGGSIAHVPELTRALRVGPRSAGADPGPACYANGGAEATVTDANLVLGHLPPTLLDGEIELDEGAARAAVEKIGEAAGLELEEAALGIIQLVNESMLGALRVVSVERGLDPRDFCLFAFGGAGPMHANALASLLGSWPVLIPRAPGVLCALGAAVTPYRNEFVTSIMKRLDRADPGAIDAIRREHTAAAEQWLDAQGISPENRTIIYQFGMRYYRQGLEIPLEVGEGWLEEEGFDGLRRRFGEAHEHLYDFSLDTEAEIVNLRVAAAGETAVVALGRHERPAGTAVAGDTGSAQVGERCAIFDEGETAAPIYDRRRLGVGARVDGPALITELDSTTVLHPGHVATIDEWLNLLIYPEGWAGPDAATRGDA
jgi:N-methylhydantoinase A